LDNYLIPHKNGRLMHVYPKLYTKCPLGQFYQDLTPLTNSC
jgi:hypothetical protein